MKHYFLLKIYKKYKAFFFFLIIFTIGFICGFLIEKRRTSNCQKTKKGCQILLSKYVELEEVNRQLFSNFSQNSETFLTLLEAFTNGEAINEKLMEKMEEVNQKIFNYTIQRRTIINEINRLLN